MLRFEVIAVALLLFIALSLLFRRSFLWRIAQWSSLCAALALLLSHPSVERYHWQLWPAFGVTVLLGCALLLPSISWRLLAINAVAITALLASIVASFVMPMFSVPAPTGPFHVGTAIYHVTDQSRRETHDPSGRFRELNIQVWYPTDASRGTRAPYRRRSETTWLASYQAAILTPAIQDVPVSQGVHPIVLFNHAWNGLRTQDTFLTTDLASHGFIVVSIDHTYNAQRIAFPDGRLVLQSSDELDDFAHEPTSKLLERANAELHVEAVDNSVVLDTLQKWNEDPANRFHSVLDVSRVGSIGHSFGGAVAIQAAITDSRIKAAVNMDGWTFGDFNAKGLNKPLLQMSDDSPFPTESTISSSDPVVRGDACFDALMLTSLERSFQDNDGYFLLIRGSKHMDFSDRPLFSPFRRFTSAGTRDWHTTATDIRRYVLSFFQQTLTGEGKSLASLPLPADDAVQLVDWKAGRKSPLAFQPFGPPCPAIPTSSQSVTRAQVK